jgi:hypothetical protein
MIDRADDDSGAAHGSRRDDEQQDQVSHFAATISHAIAGIG